MHDGELLINSGVVHSASKECMTRSGGLTSLLPLLEAITAVTEKRAQLAQSNPEQGMDRSGDSSGLINL